MALEFTGLDCCVLLTRILLIEDGISPSFTSAKSLFSRKALVKMQLLKDVVGKDTYRINNKYDDTYPTLPVEEVIRWQVRVHEGEDLPSLPLDTTASAKNKQLLNDNEQMHV